MYHRMILTYVVINVSLVLTFVFKEKWEQRNRYDNTYVLSPKMLFYFLLRNCWVGESGHFYIILIDIDFLCKRIKDLLPLLL